MRRFAARGGFGGPGVSREILVCEPPAHGFAIAKSVAQRCNPALPRRTPADSALKCKYKAQAAKATSVHSETASQIWHTALQWRRGFDATKLRAALFVTRDSHGWCFARSLVTVETSPKSLSSTGCPATCHTPLSTLPQAYEGSLVQVRRVRAAKGPIFVTRWSRGHYESSTRFI